MLTCMTPAQIVRLPVTFEEMPNPSVVLPMGFGDFFENVIICIATFHAIPFAT